MSSFYLGCSEFIVQKRAAEAFATAMCYCLKSKYFLFCIILGVILQSYGAGNVPSNYTELMDVFKEANEKHNIVMLNITQCWRGTVLGVYATGAILNTVGAVSGCVSFALNHT